MSRLRHFCTQGKLLFLTRCEYGCLVRNDVKILYMLSEAKLFDDSDLDSEFHPFFVSNNVIPLTNIGMEHIVWVFQNLESQVIFSLVLVSAFN